MGSPVESSQAHTSRELLPERRGELDALRIFVIVGLIFFHSARVFDTGEFYIKNDPTSEVVDALVGFAVMWAMPLLFVIAGIGIWHSLGSRRLGEFLVERSKRLLVPLVFGTLVIVPPQIWYRARVETGDWPDYLSFYRDFLDVELNLAGFPFVIRAAPATDYFEYGQLWFLLLLFAWSLLLIPFFFGLRRQRTVPRVIDRYGVWPVVIGSVAVLAAIGALLPLKPEVALWNPWGYLVLVAFGFVFASDKRIGARLREVRWWVLAVAVVGFLVFATVHVIQADVENTDLLVDYDPVGILFRCAFAVGGWCWVVSILSFAAARGRRDEPRDTGPRRTSRGRLAGMANEAVLPIYVLHQTVIVCIAFGVVSWSAPAAVKYLALATSALIVTFLLFALVRKLRIARFLLGMKPRRT